MNPSQTFGPEPNFLIRAGQVLEMEHLGLPIVKTIYIYAKGIKAILGIDRLKSYFVKKALLKRELQESIWDEASQDGLLVMW